MQPITEQRPELSLRAGRGVRDPENVTYEMWADRNIGPLPGPEGGAKRFLQRVPVTALPEIAVMYGAENLGVYDALRLGVDPGCP